MVKTMRVDERLMHGQVAVTWVNSLNISAILVANDEVAGNEMSKMAIKMVKPNGINLAIKTVAEGINLLNDPRTEDLAILVLVRTVADANEILKHTSSIDKINIGGVRKKEGGKLVSPAVYLNQQDLLAVQEMTQHNIPIEFRMTPADTPKEAATILKQYLEKE
ncbi:fructoselysine and glucoselysine-specific PTS system IIB component [Enterococcus sp. PF1-24]|uniref:PTS sugar transporter subunit IIB n=1 Tax=unclassified Enterococcus TaxID=2608891 RepID=UPI00247534FD|nr:MULTISPECIES: PTS sugar transporter subunit IIB [unclassified Enterococcus]MDH6365411.1 fructoselysine and glucoselysine-specific PTS system IIB component [Enterococcus sp. PFB1-1]MDH6402517.1 fructoselysine and glucoselysine-specific PTS system IIB component [Enterococcus sp. PF1-24]